MKMGDVRPAAVAGLFYPKNVSELKRTVVSLLGNAPEGGGPGPKVLIVPHAGYVYSGPVAASAYALLRPYRGTIRRVVLLGPAHHVFLKGLALPEADRFAVPGGEIALDLKGIESLGDLPQVRTSRAAHQREHSLEVQLPFLMEMLGDFLLVPLVVGETTPAEVEQVLDRLWGGEETLIVVSTDLSHYLPAEEARRIDRHTADSILDLQSGITPEEACGAFPLNGLLEAAHKKGLRPVELDLRNSGDTAGPSDQVVGYSAFAFYETPSGVSRDLEDEGQGPTLIRIARFSIASRLGRDLSPTSGRGRWLMEPGASFVTLTSGGDLRGCIGSLEAYRPLGVDVRENAIAAAFHDPRFIPLRVEELDTVRVEVSVLSTAERVMAQNEEEALAALRPGIDGVIFEYSRYRSTFLPQVWEQLPEPALFMAHLKNKAGLPADFWAEEVRLSRYTINKWKE
jgi:hypothetical protein